VTRPRSSNAQCRVDRDFAGSSTSSRSRVGGIASRRTRCARRGGCACTAPYSVPVRMLSPRHVPLPERPTDRPTDRATGRRPPRKRTRTGPHVPLALLSRGVSSLARRPTLAPQVSFISVLPRHASPLVPHVFLSRARDSPSPLAAPCNNNPKIRLHYRKLSLFFDKEKLAEKESQFEET